MADNEFNTKRIDENEMVSVFAKRASQILYKKYNIKFPDDSMVSKIANTYIEVLLDKVKYLFRDNIKIAKKKLTDENVDTKVYENRKRLLAETDFLTQINFANLFTLKTLTTFDDENKKVSTKEILIEAGPETTKCIHKAFFGYDDILINSEPSFNKNDIFSIIPTVIFSDSELRDIDYEARKRLMMKHKIMISNEKMCVITAVVFIKEIIRYLTKEIIDKPTVKEFDLILYYAGFGVKVKSVNTMGVKITKPEDIIISYRSMISRF
jgi:hypothetical protein